MDNKNALIATIGGTVTAFLTGFLIYGFLLDGFMKSQSLATSSIMKENPNMVTMVIGNLAFAVLLTYIFSRWAGIKSGSGGAAAGTIIGFLMMTSLDMIMYSTANLTTMTGIIVDILAFTVMSATTGAVIGWLLGREGK